MIGPFRLLMAGEVAAFVLIMAILVIAIALHEYGHALAATVQGDPTARNAGRLTVNPIRHLDPIGTFLLAFVGFGWGKPVPFNPAYLRNKRFGSAIVGIAGPGMNLVLAFVGALALRLLPPPTLDSGVLQPAAIAEVFVFFNVLLLLFNLIPIPPLDGSRALAALLPPRHQHVVFWLDRWGFLLLLILVFFVLPNSDLLRRGIDLLASAIIGIVGAR